MEKKLFTQIRNEWHSNLWLALELLVVSVVMWYIIDLLYSRIRIQYRALLPDRNGGTY